MITKWTLNFLVLASCIIKANVLYAQLESEPMIKSITTKTYRVTELFGDLVIIEPSDEGASDEYLYYDSFTEYDKHGFITKTKRFNTDGTLYDIYTYKLDDYHQCRKETRFYASDESYIEWFYEYEQDTLLVSCTESYDGEYPCTVLYDYTEDGLLHKINWGQCLNDGPWYSLFSYDTSRRLIRETSYGWEHDVNETTEYIYNESGELLEEIYSWGEHSIDSIYYENGYVVEQVLIRGGVMFKRVQYKYDEKGNTTLHLEIRLRRGVPVKKRVQFKYDFDEHGNWTRRVKIENLIPVLLTVRDIEYYPR